MGNGYQRTELSYSHTLGGYCIVLYCVGKLIYPFLEVDYCYTFKLFDGPQLARTVGFNVQTHDNSTIPVGGRQWAGKPLS